MKPFQTFVIKLFLTIFMLSTLIQSNYGQGQQLIEGRIDSLIPVRGISISAPSPEGVDKFVKFINEELGPAHFNLLVLLVGWNYEYITHPELRSENPLKKSDVKKIVRACKKNGIDIAPQINLLGHQSWEKITGKFLSVYPQFDETPDVKTEVAFTGFDWYNPDFFYSKSYCPLHPGVHKVLFEAIDELIDIFEAKMFHAGMDEVTIIGDGHCPRCGGRDKAELFAGEVRTIHNHLTNKGVKMMMWGDRLLNGKATGIHPSESSMNNTHRAIDMIPKDIWICDWHYGHAYQTPVYFAMKELSVLACPWNNSEVAMQQLDDMMHSRKRANSTIRPYFMGILATVWGGCDSFLGEYYGASINTNEQGAGTVKRLIERYKSM